MKFVFALVALLHLCYSYELNLTLNGEIIKRLEALNGIYRVNKANISLPDMMRVPTAEMNTHGSPCVSVFVRELKNILDNVTVPEASEHILIELQENLQLLDPHQQTDHKCRMAQSRKSLKPFHPYISFLKKLNNSKKK